MCLRSFKPSKKVPAAVMRPSGRAANYERGYQVHVLTRPGRSVDHAEEQRGGDTPGLGERLLDGGQLERLGELGAVVADHRDVLRHAPPGRTEPGEQSRGQAIMVTDYRSGNAVKPKNARRRFAAVPHAVGVGDPVPQGLLGKPSLLQRPDQAALAQLRRGGVVGGALTLAHVSEAAMSSFDEMRATLVPARLAIHVAAVKVWLEAVDKHGCELARREPACCHALHWNAHDQQAVEPARHRDGSQ